MLDTKKEFRLSKEQYWKIQYILKKDHKKVGTFIRDYIQETIVKYESKNWIINLNQTQIK